MSDKQKAIIFILLVSILGKQLTAGLIVGGVLALLGVYITTKNR